MVRFQEVFFFKQKTAYEMRISDWSSDVCSSDLGCGMASSETASAASVAVSGAISIAPATTAMAGKSLPGMAAICRSAGAIGGAATASGATSSPANAAAKPPGRTGDNALPRPPSAGCGRAGSKEDKGERPGPALYQHG